MRVEIDDSGDGIEEPRQNLPHEKKRPTEYVTGSKWGLPHGCSGPRSQQAEIRIADEVLTILAEAALKNEQIDKAMEAMEPMGMGTALNLKKEENIVVARGEGSKSVQVGLTQAARLGFFAGISKTKVRYLGAALPGTWPSLQREKQEAMQPGMRGT